MSERIITGKVRLSYANVWEAKSINEGAAKYTCSLIISKSDKETLDKIKRAYDLALKEGVQKFGAKTFNEKNITFPVHDGDVKKSDDEAYANSYYINTSSYQAPGIVDIYGSTITDQTQVYSGCYARVAITVYPFVRNGNKGVAFGLQHIQKLSDGEPLGGRSSAAETFKDYIENPEDNEDFLR